jgi:hypothetical protein
MQIQRRRLPRSGFVLWDVATVDEIVAKVESRRDAVAEGVGNNC